MLVQADVTRREQVDAMMAATRDATRPIDKLVNNANMRYPFWAVCFCAEWCGIVTGTDVPVSVSGGIRMIQ